MIGNLLIDMDGVLFRGAFALPGADTFLSWLAEKEIGFRLLTNNSTATQEQNAEKLAGMGIRVSPDDILTSSVATAQFLRKHSSPGQRAFVIGETGLLEAVKQAGVRIDGHVDAEWVICGLDRTVTYQALRTASLALERGARFLATNADKSLPVEEGEIPGAGAILAALIATTGRTPTVIGKPEPQMMLQAMAAVNGTPHDTVMLGDRLDTDIAGAQAVGMRSILVLTGVSTAAEAADSTTPPNFVFEDLPALMKAWPD